MAGYNFFFIDPHGAVLRRLPVEAESDEDLVEQIARLDDGHDIEIWDGERLVMIFRSARRRP